MQHKALKLIFAVFSVLWMIIIFSEYWRYNPIYGKAIEFFQYYDLLVLYIAVGAGLTWFLKKPRQKPLKHINGLSIFTFVLFLNALAVNRFTVKESGLSFSMGGLFTHLGHITGVATCLFLLYLFTRVLGSIFTRIFPIKVSKSDLPLIQTALGILFFTFFMFFLGLLGLLNPFVIAPICLMTLALYWQHTYLVFKETLLTSIKIPKTLNALGVFSFLLLSIFLVLNFAQILRPFPIGSDSLRIYVNLASLIADYGGLVDGHQPYNWSLFMSTGLVVFGRMDVVLGVSFLGGILALHTLYRLSRKWLNVNYAALVLILFYSLPMVSFMSYMDMKVDMGLLFFTLTTLLLFYHWMQPVEDNLASTPGLGLSKANAFFKKNIPTVLLRNRLLVLMGVIMGFAFGIKLTVLFLVFALINSIWYFQGNKVTLLTTFTLGFAIIFLLKLDDQPALRQFHDNVRLLQILLFTVGFGLLIYLFVKQRKKLFELLTYSVIVGAFFALPILPWVGKNLSETNTVSVLTMLNGKKASPNFKVKKTPLNAAKVIIPGLYQMPDVPDPEPVALTERDKKKIDRRKRGNNTKSGVSEDLHRFMGYEVTPIRYLSLPYDVCMKTNITNFFVDVGFVLLLLFPILFLFAARDKLDRKSLLANLAFIGLSSLLLFISIPSAFLNKHNLSSTSEGLSFLKSSSSTGVLGSISDRINSIFLNLYGPLHDWLLDTFSIKNAFTYPIMLVLFLIMLQIFAIRMRRHSNVTKGVVLFMLMYFFLWWILGAGAAWYGMMLFCVPFIFLFKGIDPDVAKDDSDSKIDFFQTAKKYVFLGVAVVWMLLAFVLRTTNYKPLDETTANRLYFPPIMKYSMGEMNENKLMDHHFPNVRELVKIINRDKNSLVYMVGSPFGYFITKNDRRVLSDTYLDFFEPLVQQEKTKENIIAKLKEKGFKYILFDLKTPGYDVTPNKTLTKKYTQLLNTLYGNPQVELVATNRRIQLNTTGEEVFAVFPDKGTIVNSGDIAIFRIK